MPEPRGKFAILLVSLAVGPGVIGIITLVEKTRLIPYSGVEGVFAVVLGALWGLTGGILRRSLSKSILGLNLGAFIGFFVSPNAPGYAREGLLVVAILLFLIIGGAVLNYSSREPVESAVLGVVAAFAAIFAAFFSSMMIAVADSFLRMEQLGILVPIPITAGLFVFFWLNADVFPRKEAERQKRDEDARQKWIKQRHPPENKEADDQTAPKS